MAGFPLVDLEALEADLRREGLVRESKLVYTAGAGVLTIPNGIVRSDGTHTIGEDPEFTPIRDVIARHARTHPGAA